MVLLYRKYLCTDTKKVLKDAKYIVIFYFNQENEMTTYQCHVLSSPDLCRVSKWQSTASVLAGQPRTQKKVTNVRAQVGLHSRHTFFPNY